LLPIEQLQKSLTFIDWSR